MIYYLREKSKGGPRYKLQNGSKKHQMILNEVINLNYSNFQESGAQVRFLTLKGAKIGSLLH